MSKGRHILNSGLDAAIAVIRDYRTQPEAVMVRKLADNPHVRKLVLTAASHLNAASMLIILRHRHAELSRTESLALDAWMTEANKASSEKAIGKAMALIKQEARKPCTSSAP